MLSLFAQRIFSNNTDRPESNIKRIYKRVLLIFKPLVSLWHWISGRKAEFWTAVSTGVIALFTVVIAGVGYYQWKEIHEGGKDTHTLAEATLAGSRAWVAPEQVVLGSPIESGLPLKYQIRLVNPGKEPALGVVWKIHPFGVSYIQQQTGDAPHLGTNEECYGLNPDPQGGIVLYPSGAMNFWLPLAIANNAEYRSLIDSVHNREKTLFIEGCFAYLAATQKHTSAFRFFLRDVPGPSFIPDKQGNPVPAWNFNFALGGNQAN